MRSFISQVSSTAVVLAAVAAAQNFRVVGQIYSGTPGDTYTYRTWYGDGNLFVGPKIPASLENTLNFTSYEICGFDILTLADING